MDIRGIHFQDGIILDLTLGDGNVAFRYVEDKESKQKGIQFCALEKSGKPGRKT